MFQSILFCLRFIFDPHRKYTWLKPSLSFHFSTPQTLFTFLPWPIQSKNLDDHPHHDSPLIKSKSWLRNSLESREYFVKFLKLETFGPKRLFQGRHWFASLTTVEGNFTVTKIQKWLSNFDLRLSNIELLLATFIYLAQWMWLIEVTKNMRITTTDMLQNKSNPF